MRTGRRKKGAVLDLEGEEYVPLGTQAYLVNPLRWVCQYATPRSFSRENVFAFNLSHSGSCSVQMHRESSGTLSNDSRRAIVHQRIFISYPRSRGVNFECLSSVAIMH